MAARSSIRARTRANKASVFEYLDDRHARWKNAEDGWLFGYFRYGWADRTLKIRGVDTARKRIACAPYDLQGENMGAANWFNKGKIRYFAFNLLEELDHPGEWYLDRKTGILYLYPPVRSRQSRGGDRHSSSRSACNALAERPASSSYRLDMIPTAISSPAPPLPTSLLSSQEHSGCEALRDLSTFRPRQRFSLSFA